MLIGPSSTAAPSELLPVVTLMQVMENQVSEVHVRVEQALRQRRSLPPNPFRTRR